MIRTVTIALSALLISTSAFAGGMPAQGGIGENEPIANKRGPGTGIPEHSAPGKGDVPLYSTPKVSKERVRGEFKGAPSYLWLLANAYGCKGDK